MFSYLIGKARSPVDIVIVNNHGPRWTRHKKLQKMDSGDQKHRMKLK
jgi:hypothetical protein